jgi:hypothetical protein
VLYCQLHGACTEPVAQVSVCSDYSFSQPRSPPRYALTHTTYQHKIGSGVLCWVLSARWWLCTRQVDFNRTDNRNLYSGNPRIRRPVQPRPHRMVITRVLSSAPEMHLERWTHARRSSTRLPWGAFRQTTNVPMAQVSFSLPSLFVTEEFW